MRAAVFYVGCSKGFAGQDCILNEDTIQSVEDARIRVSIIKRNRNTVRHAVFPYGGTSSEFVLRAIAACYEEPKRGRSGVDPMR